MANRLYIVEAGRTKSIVCAPTKSAAVQSAGLDPYVWHEGVKITEVDLDAPKLPCENEKYPYCLMSKDV